jgi:hypothetical protein
MIETANPVIAQIETMSPIWLNEIKTLALLDRLDIKFFLPEEQLAQILRQIQSRYRVLEVNGVRAGRYRTTYFDTPDFKMFAAHHSGQRDRYKVRWRWYIDSKLVYLEVKKKNNRERTVKTRTVLPAPPETLLDVGREWLPPGFPIDPAELQPVVWNSFQRITLADSERQERVTIDVDLQFGQGGRRFALAGLAIVEIKQRKFSLSSPIAQELHRLHVLPAHISKYCVSIATLYPELKHNRFKPLLRRLSTLCERFCGEI